MFFAQLTGKEEENLRNLFHEDSERIRKDLEHLREWLKKQPHLPHDMDNTMMLNFLRGRKYSLQETKVKLDKYYTYRGALPELCSNLDPLSGNMKFSMENQVFCILPDYTPEGYRVFINCYEGVEVDRYDYDMLTKRLVSGYDAMLAFDALKRGVVGIVDLAAFRAGHALRISVPQVKKTLTLIQEGYPDQFKKIFVVGLSPVAVRIANIFLQFLKEKLKKRVVFLDEKNMDELYEVIPRKMLPSEYGGSTGSKFELNKRWSKELVGRREWMMQMGEKKADEAKRPGKPKTATELLGIEGSFRQLAVD